MTTKFASDLLFWQPRRSWFHRISQLKRGHILIIVSNYIIWLFLFYLSYLLIRQDIKLFGQLFVATIISEIIEKSIKFRCFWRRPLFVKTKTVPAGMIKSWYIHGSFPSGHTIKTIFFFLFLLQYPVFPPELFLLLTLPLVIFRVLIGFHYPIDVFGGIIIGVPLWFFSSHVFFPDTFNSLIKTIFDLVFPFQ